MRTHTSITIEDELTGEEYKIHPAPAIEGKRRNKRTHLMPKKKKRKK